MARYPASGHPAVEAYLADGFERVVGMSSRFAAAICARLLRLQTTEGVSGPIAEIGAFEGRFFIALAHALEPGEIARRIPELAALLKARNELKELTTYMDGKMAAQDLIEQILTNTKYTGKELEVRDDADWPKAPEEDLPAAQDKQPE